MDLCWYLRLKELHEAGTLAVLNAYRNVRVIMPTVGMATSSGHLARLERRAGRPMAVRNMTDFPQEGSVVLKAGHLGYLGYIDGGIDSGIAGRRPSPGV